jgi:hypothetical protein
MKNIKPFTRALFFVFLLICLLTGLAGTLRTAVNAAPQNASALDVVINEIAWGGTDVSANDEWIELYNNTGSNIDLSSWSLNAIDGTPSIALSGVIPAGGYFLLERTDDTTVSDITADIIYTGAMEDGGEVLELRDDLNNLIDTANISDNAWPGGDGGTNASMERVDSIAADSDANWGTNDGVIVNGLDANNNPINGTPKLPGQGHRHPFLMNGSNSIMMAEQLLI